MQKFSICIPTYDRHKALKEIIKNYIEQDFNEDLSLSILDDYPEKRNEDLENINKRIFYQKNSTNIGYASSFFKLFEITKAEYLIFSSDDDIINFNNINKLLNNDSLDSSYNCISTTFYHNKSLYRGREALSPIKLNEIRSASNHAPGLIYKRSGVIKYIDQMKHRISSGCYFTQTYPQVALFYACYFDKGGLMWHPLNIVNTGYQLPSKIKVNGIYGYSHPVSRMTEFKSVIAFLEDCRIHTPSASKQILKTLIRHRLGYHNSIVAPYRQKNKIQYFKTYQAFLFYCNCICYSFFNYFMLFRDLLKLSLK